MNTRANDIKKERSRRGEAALADAVRLRGTEHHDRGQTAKAEGLYLESLQLSEMTGFASGRAHALNCLGSVEQRRGNLDVASRYFESALSIATRGREPELVGMLQQNIGVISDIRGNSIAAIAYYKAALATLGAVGNKRTTLKVLNNLGYLCTREQRDDEAKSLLQRAVKMARQCGDLMSEGIIEENRAELELSVGDLEAARASIDRALAIADRRDDTLRYASALKLKAETRRRLGDVREAVDTLQHAIALSIRGEDALLSAELLYRFGCAIWELGDVPYARDVLSDALCQFERIAARGWAARVHRRLAEGASGRYC